MEPNWIELTLYVVITFAVCTILPMMLVYFIMGEWSLEEAERKRLNRHQRCRTCARDADIDFYIEGIPGHCQRCKRLADLREIED